MPISSCTLDAFHSQGGTFVNIEFYSGTDAQATTFTQDQVVKMVPKSPLKLSEQEERSKKRLPISRE